jgi:CRISPR-associated protein Csb2
VPKLDDNGLQIGSAEHELRRLLKLNCFPAPILVEPVPSTDLAGHETRWLAFQRDRNHGNGRREASGYGYGFRIKFPEQVQGPIALGYGAHFGLGLFVPESPLIAFNHDLNHSSGSSSPLSVRAVRPDGRNRGQRSA